MTIWRPCTTFFAVFLTFYVCSFVQVSHGKSNAVHAPEIDEPLGFFITGFFPYVFWTAILHSTGARAVQRIH